MKEDDLKHELYAHKFAQHFDLNADLFFCFARVDEDLRKHYPFGDVLRYYHATFQMSQNQRICSIILHVQAQQEAFLQPEIHLHYDIAQQEIVHEQQLEQLLNAPNIQENILQVIDLHQLNVEAILFKYITQAKHLFVQWNVSYYPLQFNQFRLTVFEKSSLEHASTFIVLTQPEPILLQPHFKQDQEEPPLKAYIIFDISQPPFIFHHFIHNKTVDISRHLSLQPKERVKRQNEKLRQHAKLEHDS